MLIIIVMAVVVVALAAWLLTRPIKDGRAGREEAIALAYTRDELLKHVREVDEDRRDGRLDETVAADERRRLEYELAQTVKQLDQLGAASADSGTLRLRHRALGAVAIALVLVLFGGSLEYWQNKPALQTFAHVNNKGQVEDLHSLPPMVANMMAKLEGHLKYHPHDTNGWVELGRAEMMLGHVKKARVAYGKAYKLAPNNFEIVSTYAWLMYTAHPSQTPAFVEHLYREVYARDPKAQGALWFLGLAALHRHHLHRALMYWTRLQGELPPSKARLGVTQAIAKIHRALGMPSKPMTHGRTLPAPHG